MKVLNINLFDLKIFVNWVEVWNDGTKKDSICFAGCICMKKAKWMWTNEVREEILYIA